MIVKVYAAHAGVHLILLNYPDTKLVIYNDVLYEAPAEVLEEIGETEFLVDDVYLNYETLVLGF